MRRVSKAVNLRTGDVLGDNILIAETFFHRMIGLLGRKRLLTGEGLYLPNCSSIHTFFMRFPIDVVFLDKDHGVAKLIESLVPFRLAMGPWGTHGVLELRNGALKRAVCRSGDVIGLQR